MEILIGMILGVLSTSAAGMLWLLLRDPLPRLEDVSMPRELPGGLRAYSCTRWQDGRPYGIVLYGTSARQIEDDHPGVRVDVRYIGEFEA